jgi:tetratricopeptide (TPR) repeat protein
VPLLLLVVWFAYVPGLSGPLMLDDFATLFPLTKAEAGEIPVSEALWRGEVGPLGRPVSMMSFWLNWLSTGDSVWYLKYTNLLLHLLCGTLVFWLSGRLLQQPSARMEKARWWLALWVAAVWLLSPLMVSTVLYTVQRMTILSALFVLAGLLVYVAGRQNLDTRPRLGLTLVILAFLAFLPLAAFSKENGLLLPLLALVIELFFFRFQGTEKTSRLIYLVFGICLALPVVAVLGKTALTPDWIVAGYQGRDFTLFERLLTQPRVLLDYAFNLYLPRGPVMGLFHDDFQKSTGLISPPSTLVAVSALSALALAAIWAWKRNSGVSIVFGGLIFFLAAHLMESSVFPLELYFEHRNYLPAVGLIIGSGYGLFSLVTPARRSRVLTVAVALMPVAYAAATHQRALVWQAWPSIVMAAEKSHPRSFRVHAEAAAIHIGNGDLESALRSWQRADALSPSGRASSGVALSRLAGYCRVSMAIPAEDYKALARVFPPDQDAYTINSLERLVLALERGRCRTLEPRRLARVLKAWDDPALVFRSTYWQWKYYLFYGRLLKVAGRPDEALGYLSRAFRLLPEEPLPLVLTVDYYISSGEIAEAKRVLVRLKAADDGERRPRAGVVAAFEERIGRREQGEALRAARASWQQGLMEQSARP